MVLRLKSTAPHLKFYKPLHCTVLDLITGISRQVSFYQNSQQIYPKGKADLDDNVRMNGVLLNIVACSYKILCMVDNVPTKFFFLFHYLTL
jgi:hypothetical protein